MNDFECRFCRAPLTETFVDLGLQPLANAYVEPEKRAAPETFYPLHTFVCSACRLVQLPMAAEPEEIFSDYAYFSSYSDSWLEHARQYAAMAVERFALDEKSRVIEIASNDGYLLRWLKERGVEVLGIEPAENVAEAARILGIPSRVAFFGTTLAEELAREDLKADLLIGNNVLAHTPYLNDFVAGLAIALGEGGAITLEFPHLQKLVEQNQFDTIYHEHFSYFSFSTVKKVLEHHGLEVFDVEEWPTHGGSLRVFAQHSQGPRQVEARVAALAEREKRLGYLGEGPYRAFGEKVKATKRRFLEFLLRAKDENRRVVGYGAPAKGNTFLNYCGVRTDFLDYTVDRNPHKQGLFLPGTRIPIRAPEDLLRDRPEHVLILPWNLRQEIAGQMEEIRSWGGQFVVAIPDVEIF